MKIHNILIVIILLSVTVSANAANKYWIDATGGAGTWSACESDTDPGSGNRCTMTQAITYATAGDTIYLIAGTYTTAIIPSNSGSPGSPITYQIAPGESQWSVKISNSSNRCVYLTETKDYHTFDGLYFYECEGNWAYLNGADNIIFQNDRFYSADAYSGIVIGNFADNYDSDDNVIDNCIFDDAIVQDSSSGSDYWDATCQSQWDTHTAFDSICDRGTMPEDAVRIDRGYRNIIKNSNFNNVAHDAISVTPYEDGDYNNVIKENSIENAYHRGVNILSHALIEGNLIKRNGLEKQYNPRKREREEIDGGCSSTNSPYGAIFRYNVFRDGDSGTYFGHTGSGEATGIIIVHNTYYNNYHQLKLLGNSYANYSGTIVKNNIFFTDGNFQTRTIYLSNNPGHSALVNYSDAGTVINYWVNNMWVADDDTYYFKNTYTLNKCLESGSGGSCGNGYLETLYSSEWDSSNFEGSPAFIDPANDDFSIGSTSDAIDGATALTTTTNSGSSQTQVTVDDASFFYDGWSISGETADTIWIVGTGQVTITSINYSTDTITLTASATWSSGQDVYYCPGGICFSGSAPDVGAYEYVAAQSTQTISSGVNLSGVVMQ